MAPVILGIDFLHKHGLILDFTHNPVIVSSSHQKVEAPVEKSMAVAQVFPIYIYEATKSHISEVCATSIDQESEVDIVDDCAIPDYNAPLNVELPSSSTPGFQCVLEKYHKLFCTKPGYTERAWHYIPTVSNPIKVPPRRIPMHYRNEGRDQIQTMLEGIIRCSKSPWMAPVVFVSEKSGQIRICVDHRELNKRTTKDSYPSPLPDEVKDKLQFSPHSTSIVGIGSSQSILQTGRKLISVQGLAWDYMSSSECPLD